jgi:hypothetical protein
MSDYDDMPELEPPTEEEKKHLKEEQNVAQRVHEFFLQDQQLIPQSPLPRFFDRDDAPVLPRTAAAPGMRLLLDTESLSQETDEDTEETLSYCVSSSEDDEVFDMDPLEEETKSVASEESLPDEEDNSEPSDAENLMDDSPDASVSYESDVEDCEFIDDKDL